MRRRELLIRACIDPDTLDLWLASGWLAPLRAGGEWMFSEIDLARTQLIRDLTHEFGVNDEGIPIILGLVDQIHGLRCALGEMLMVLRAQPANTRELLAAELRALRLERDGKARYETPRAASHSTDPD